MNLRRSDLLVLGAIIALRNAGRCVTLRAIGEVVRYESLSYQARAIHRLRLLGLVTFEVDEHCRLLGNTVQPTCKVIPASELGKAKL